MSASTQRDVARESVKRLCANAVDRTALVALRDVVGEAQNPPPDGKADGSIDPETWAHLGELARSFLSIQSTLRVMREARGR